MPCATGYGRTTPRDASYTRNASWLSHRGAWLGGVEEAGAHGVAVRRPVDLCRTLVRVDSTNPPGDTTAIVEAIEAVLDDFLLLDAMRRVVRASNAIGVYATRLPKRWKAGPLPLAR